MEIYECDYLERKVHYQKINPFANMFAFAKNYSSDYFENNIFNIYLEENEIFLMPGDRALVAIIEYTPGTFILPSPEFYGPYLKLECKIVKDDNYATLELYIHNSCLDSGNRTPDYASLEHFYHDVFDYVGDASIPVYHQIHSKLIAIGIRAKYDFDIEKLYSRLYENLIVVESFPEDTLKKFEDYKNWILDAKNSKRLYTRNNETGNGQRTLKPNSSKE